MAEPEKMWDNPVLGTTTYAHDGEGDEIILETVQHDIEPIIEGNKQAFNDAEKSWGDGKIVASIPIIVMQQLVQKGVLSQRWAILDEKRFRDWLNDPENRFFRTRPGQV